jgi:hypothetical protein
VKRLPATQSARPPLWMTSAPTTPLDRRTLWASCRDSTTNPSWLRRGIVRNHMPTHHAGSSFPNVSYELATPSVAGRLPPPRGEVELPSSSCPGAESVSNSGQRVSSPPSTRRRRADERHWRAALAPRGQVEGVQDLAPLSAPWPPVSEQQLSRELVPLRIPVGRLPAAEMTSGPLAISG